MYDKSMQLFRSYKLKLMKLWNNYLSLIVNAKGKQVVIQTRNVIKLKFREVNSKMELVIIKMQNTIFCFQLYQVKCDVRIFVILTFCFWITISLSFVLRPLRTSQNSILAIFLLILCTYRRLNINSMQTLRLPIRNYLVGSSQCIKKCNASCF